MKVALITPYFYPHVGGVEAYCLQVARRLRRERGWEVVIVTTGGRGSKTTIETVHGLRVYRLGYTFNLSNTPIGLGWRRELRRIFKQEQPDVINGHTPVPYLADIAERVSGATPFVYTYHNDIQKDSWTHKIIVKCLYGLLVNHTLRRAVRIIATSDYYVSQSRYLTRWRDKITAVPPGVDLTLFNPRGRPVRKKQAVQTILFVGSLAKAQQYKGLDILIYAFSKVHAAKPNTTLVIVGGGDGRAMYEQQARDLGVADAVTFAGSVPHHELPKYFREATVSALPSTNATEGFGMVIIEASACGTPVVGSRIGGIPFAIAEDVTGLLVPPKDPTALTQALQRLLDDAQLARRLGEAGAERTAQLFDWSQLVKLTDQALRQALQPTLAHVAGYYPPHLGGMEKVAQAMAEELAQRGHHVRILTSDIAQPAELEPAQQNLTITRLKSFEFAHTPFAPGFIRELWRLPRHTIAHLHLAQAFYPEWTWLLCRLRRMPYVLHFHLDLQPSGPLGPVFKLYKKVVIRTVIRSANVVIVFSKDQQTFIHQTYGVPNKRIAIIPNGVGPEYFAQKPRTRTPKAPFQLLYIGRLSPQKRVDRLLDMLMDVHVPVHLTLVGDGELRSELEARAKWLGLTNVTFAGQKTPEETRAYHKKADAFVLASEREGMPLVALEAMAAGLPLIGANVTGIREVVRDVGLLVRKPTGKTFAATLNDLLATPEKLVQLSQRSYKEAVRYTWSASVDALEKTYREVHKQ